MKYQLYKANTIIRDNNAFLLQDENNNWYVWSRWGKLVGWGKVPIPTPWLQQNIHPVSRLQFLVETGYHITNNDILFARKETSIYITECLLGV